MPVSSTLINQILSLSTLASLQIPKKKKLNLTFKPPTTDAIQLHHASTVCYQTDPVFPKRGRGIIILINGLYKLQTHPQFLLCFGYLHSFVVHLHRLQHKVHPDCVAMTLHVEPVLETLYDARLSDPGVADNNDLEKKVVRIVRLWEDVGLSRRLKLCGAH